MKDAPEFTPPDALDHDAVGKSQMKDAPEFTPPDAYPPLVSPRNKAALLLELTSPALRARLETALEEQKAGMAEAVEQSCARLQQAAAAADYAAVYAEAHEIRGLAGTAGLEASGVIADRLCHYLEAASAQGGIEAGIAGLHVGAIAEAARAGQDAAMLGLTVAEELRALAERRLKKSPRREP